MAGCGQLALLLGLLAAPAPASPAAAQRGPPALYHRGDALPVAARGMRSAMTAIPHDYYVVPRCPPRRAVPAGEGGGFGSLLWGDHSRPTAMTFMLLQPVSCQKLCSVPGPPDVDWEELEMLKALIDRQYRAVLTVDGLPAAEAFRGGLLVGHALGGAAAGYRPSLVHNHLDFTVTVHKAEEQRGYHVTGVSVRPYSVRSDRIDDYCTPALDWAPAFLPPQEVRLGEQAPRALSWSYSLRWVVSNDVRWHDRWRPYVATRQPALHPRAAAWTAALLALLAPPALYALLRCGPDRPAEADPPAGPAEPELDCRAQHSAAAGPALPELLVVLVAVGCQLLGTAAEVLAGTTLGLASAADPGSLTSCAVLSFVLAAPLGGYAAARWAPAFHLPPGPSVVIVAVAGPGALLGLFALATAVLNTDESASTPTSGTFVQLLGLWLLGHMPLVAGGAALGRPRHGELPGAPAHPCRPAVADTPRLRLLGWAASIALAALVLFSAALPALLSALRTLWRFEPFDQWRWLALEAGVFAGLCAEVGVLLAAATLWAGPPWGWWWGPYLTGGVAGLYALACVAVYFGRHTQLVEVGPAALYFGWMFALVAAAALATGTALFLTAACLGPRLGAHLKP
eukprot:EG_transcript_5676